MGKSSDMYDKTGMSSKSDMGDIMQQTWSVGVEHNNGDELTIWADDVTFPEGMRILLEKVQNAYMEDSTDNNASDYLLIIGDITDITDDSGIMDDPDQWDDNSFYGPDDIEWFIVAN